MALSAVLVLLALLSWSQLADDRALSATGAQLQQALAVAGLARVLNGVISVAQDTELALQPAGVGVTIGVGEILDPLNDLVERFAMLALIASAALTLQLTLGQILATVFFSALLTAVTLAYLWALWAPQASRGLHNVLRRSLAIALFLRFAPAVVLLATHWLNVAFLAPMQTAATQQLEITTDSVEALGDDAQTVPPQAVDPSLLDRATSGLSRLWEDTTSGWATGDRLESLEQEVEASISAIIDLIVVFVLQTLLLPIAALWLCWRGFGALWQRSDRTSPPP